MFRHVSTGKTRNKLLGGAATMLLGALAIVPSAQATEELNALVWCDHTDPALIAPFEKKYDVKVNLKEYEGTGALLIWAFWPKFRPMPCQLPTFSPKS